MRNHILVTAIMLITGLAAAPVAGWAQDRHGGDHGGAHGQDGPGHGVDLHVSARWKECSIQLHASLTQGAWRQFTREAGLVAYFRPIADAEPMGRGNWEVALMQWETGIDDAESAWNDTFVHPDSAHWLFEGQGLQFPGFTARAGVSDRVDVGIYLTKNPNANYGFYGGQVQYNIARSEATGLAASARASLVSLFGPEDAELTVFGADLLASKRYALRWVSVSPYAGVSSYLSTSHERSAAVSLSDETVLGARGMVGVTSVVSVARIGVEYSVAQVNSFSLKVGVGF